MSVDFAHLLPSFACAYISQLLFAFIFVPLQSEIFYDTGGSLGFLSATYISLYFPFLKAKYIDGVSGAVLPALTEFASRQLLISGALVVWCVRLGSYLGLRALKAGGDSRFEKVRQKPIKFTIYWLIQATWIALVGLPVYLTNAVPVHQHPDLCSRDFIAVTVFSVSFLIEVIADEQKAAWKRAKDRKQHDERFIRSGLWAFSRHPNYIGEVGIWTGIWLLSTTSLQTNVGAAILAAVSPLFTWFLLRNVSGVPLLEGANDKKFGSDSQWVHYKRTVPVFWPWGSVI